MMFIEDTPSPWTAQRSSRKNGVPQLPTGIWLGLTLGSVMNHQARAAARSTRTRNAREDDERAATLWPQAVTSPRLAALHP